MRFVNTVFMPYNQNRQNNQKKGNNNMAYNGRIVEIRKKHRKTQTETAEYLDIKQQQYSKYERGINEIPLRYIIKLCKYYNETADEILGLAPGAHNEQE